MDDKEKVFKQLCVMHGVTCDNAEDFEKHFKDLGFTVKFAECTLTNPDTDHLGNAIPETGGRSDLLFYIAQDEINRFALPRLQWEIRWWEDVVSYNNHASWYTKEILDKYPVTW